MSRPPSSTSDVLLYFLALLVPPVPINLFISELLMSLGGMLDAKWANESAVYCGGFCNAQGSLQYLGETSVALWTLAVTLHTWQSVVYAKPIPFRWLLCAVVMVLIWGFVFAFNFAAFSAHPKGGDDSYFTPGPFWCWINSKYGSKRLAGEYLWLWVAGFGNLLVYIPLFLLLRGHIVLGNEGFKSHRWYWTPPPVRRGLPFGAQAVPANSPIPDDVYEEELIRKEATKMLWYPAAYTLLVLPLSIVRWTTFTTPDLDAIKLDNDRLVFHSPMVTATLVFHAIFRLSGIINVVLVLTTRPNVLLFGEHPQGRDVSDGGNVSPRAYGTPGAGSVEDIFMRQRHNATFPEEQIRGYTGFGGPAIINRRDDDSSITEKR
ncbi:unnamed protein product [Rhizoctonia solani]|uniref:Glucose receptor Git3 N-terminal domain-containing protein n=1 Tax=Rhizoctonia solani TaxID=456999 RepID=A0A8H3E1Q1_9AGAM|nr:unnamed protein product [Rhizoctonia solani]